MQMMWLKDQKISSEDRLAAAQCSRASLRHFLVTSAAVLRPTPKGKGAGLGCSTLFCLGLISLHSLTTPFFPEPL